MKVFCDSSTREACYVIEGQRPVIIPYSKPVTNNVGEYMAVILALEAVKYIKRVGAIELFTDSEFVVNQVRGYDKFGNIWKKCLPHLQPFRDKVKELAQELQVTIVWLPREENLAGRVLG